MKIFHFYSRSLLRNATKGDKEPRVSKLIYMLEKLNLKFLIKPLKWNKRRNSVKLDANNNSRLVTEQSSSIPFRSTKKLSYSMEKITWSSSNSSLSSSSTSSSSPTKTGGIKLNNQVSETSKPILRICGNLEKMSLSGLKLWRKRYFVLTDNILQYFSG